MWARTAINTHPIKKRLTNIAEENESVYTSNAINQQEI